VNKTGSNLGRIALTWGAGGFALATVLGGVVSAGAQGLASHNTNAPVSFDAGSIALDDRANRVVLTGGVTINQAGLAVRSNRMLAQYSDAGSLDVAVYDFNRRIITMAGNVQLQRGADTLNGGRLVIDLDSGLSSVDGRASGGSVGTTGSNGRVTGTFRVPQNND